MNLMNDLPQRILDLEDYQPVINERLAANELAIQALQEQFSV